MEQLIIKIPPSIENMGPNIHQFIDLMLEKLNKNSHKKSVNRHDVNDLMGKLIIEVGEFIESYHADLLDVNNERELADVANFALLVFIALQIERRAK